MRSEYKVRGLAFLMMSVAAFPLNAEEVRIYSPDGAVEMFGELLEVRENEFIIQSAVGPMTVDRSKVLCEGAACPQEEVAEAPTKIVRIYSEDGAVDMQAELLDVRETELVIRTAVGPMAVDRSKVLCEGAACPVAEETAEPETMVVRLTSADGAIEMVGELLEITDTSYVVQTAVGPMTLDRTRVGCEGPACPETTVGTADFVFAGASEVGQGLMPSLLAGYARELGGTLEGPTAADANTAQFTVRSASGETLFIANVKSSDDRDGLQSLIDGSARVAMALRPASPQEVNAAVQAGTGDLLSLDQELVVGMDALEIVVSPRLPVDALSIGQVRDIYLGNATNWSQIGGPDLPITAIARDGNSPARQLFDGFVFEEPTQVASSVLVMDSSREVASWVASNNDSIGYVSVDSIRETKPVDLALECGLVVETSPFQTKSEEYSLGRRVRLYTDGAPKDEHLQGLLDYAVSSKADDAFTEAGFVGLGIAVDPDVLQFRLDHPERGADAGDLRGMARVLDGAARLSTTVRFESNSLRLDGKAQRDLDRLVDFMAQPENAGKEVIFAGFADALGDAAYNTQLSGERADVVLNEFRRMASSRLSGIQSRAVGFGEVSPVACNTTNEGRSVNRRVEVWIR